MWIGICKMDDKGRLTLPKSFRDANKIDSNTKIYLHTMQNSENTVKLVFIKDKTDEN